MSVLQLSSDLDPNLCLQCLTDVMRTGKQHNRCFDYHDYLDHGPNDFEALRCDICRGWRTDYFVQAKANYHASSQARLDAVTLHS